jgi:hypothetical protein
MKQRCLVSLFLTFTVFTLAAQSFGVGDKVEAYNVGWYKATILEVGSGDYVGYYKVHYDEYSSASDQWLKNASIRAVKTQKIFSTATGPRGGKYHLYTYLQPQNPIRLGHFTLSSSSYSFYDNGGGLIGSGTYKYIPAQKIVQWTSGPFKKNEWEGSFEIGREGKTHSINLKRGTVGLNSTDSK